MTDKQIIIDGVDVSGCEYYDDGTCCNKDVFTLSCENTNCMCKQLKRKEQECDELQKTANAYNYLVKIANYRLDKIEYLQQQLDQLKQTLVEIKELAKKAKKDICNNCDWINTDSCDPEDYTCGEFIKILQKISECEVLK